MNTVEPVTCALMALEKWLMEAEAKRDVQDVVHRLFKEGRSIAFAGLLICVGKAQPSFLLTHLRPLLAQWHVYIWTRAVLRTVSALAVDDSEILRSSMSSGETGKINHIAR